MFVVSGDLPGMTGLRDGLGASIARLASEDEARVQLAMVLRRLTEEGGLGQLRDP